MIARDNIRRVLGGVSLERGLESTRSLRKWVVLGVAIGVVAGLGAVVFYSALEWATKLLIGGIAGYWTWTYDPTQIPARRCVKNLSPRLAASPSPCLAVERKSGTAPSS